MISSYALSERVNFQTILWDSTAFVVWSVRTTVRTAWLAFQMALIALAYAVVTVYQYAVPITKALALVALVVAGAFAVSMIPVTFWAGLAISGALAYVGYPRVRTRKVGK